MNDAPMTLAEGLRLADISDEELWTRYLAIGGSGSVEDVRHHVESAACPDDHEHNLLAQALNEVFLEDGGDHPVAYRHLSPPPLAPDHGG